MEEDNEKLIDITQPIRKPKDFDELLALTNYYQEMEQMIVSLNKTLNSCLTIDEDTENKEADIIELSSEYSTLFINILEDKMREIRNVLNYN